MQVPSMWRPVVEDPATLQLFLDIYGSARPPLSCHALECLVWPHLLMLPKGCMHQNMALVSRARMIALQNAEPVGSLCRVQSQALNLSQ